MAPQSTVLIRFFFLLASWTLSGVAQASYGQMRLDGITLLLALMLAIAYGLCVDMALFARIFRARRAFVLGTGIAGVLVFLVLGLSFFPSEQGGFFNGPPGGSGLVMFAMTSAVFLPFILLAPHAQYRAMRQGRRWPGWITAWMVLQIALLPGFMVLAATNEYFWKQEYADGQAEGREIRAGGLVAMVEKIEQRHERIWGTGWTYPWKQKVSPGSFPQPSEWAFGMAKSIDASALIAANEPLSTADRTALQALVTRQLGSSYTIPRIWAKLLWDKLEPGNFAMKLAPTGVEEVSAVNEAVLPVVLDRLEKDGAERLCPGGRMMDDDRAVLQALVVAKGRVWSVEKQDYEMRKGWDGFQLRVERLCPGPQ